MENQLWANTSQKCAMHSFISVCYVNNSIGPDTISPYGKIACGTVQNISPLDRDWFAGISHHGRDHGDVWVVAASKNKREMFALGREPRGPCVLKVT